jgi:hypothetical protein
VLLLLLALATLPPFVARALHSPVGDFAMFSGVGRYRLELSVLEPTGNRAISRAELAPHLSRDARLVILPTGDQGYGDDQADLLEWGLSDLGRLLCELRPAASSATVRLGRSALGAPDFRWTESRTPCRGGR